jgi:membrane protein DedA with SNARE-associated domain/rhodanese-related sulfurtransferase
MDIQGIADAIRQDAVSVVFVNVLLQQLGLPIPAVPTLLVAGSLILGGGQAAQILAAAVAASVLADLVWYGAGRAFGYRVLAGLCRLSINPASCVSQTEGRIARWGLASLVVAKFVPGFSTVAPPIAGALRMSLPGFLLAAGLGALLWGGAAVAAGWALRAQLQAGVEALSRHGGALAVGLFVAFGLWLGWKFWQKFRFERLAAIPHVSPAELVAAMASDRPPLVLDLRGAAMVAETGVVPGAVAAEHDRLAEAVGDWPRSAPIVTLCACPEDAGAIQAARALLAQGYTAVRPLRGGFDALPPELRPDGKD